MPDRALARAVQTKRVAPATGARERFRLLLINPYELGRQPFALAQAAAWLRRDGFEVACLDLSLQRLEPDALAQAHVVALYLGMHTATRLAFEALPRIRALAPHAHLCAFGLYAPMNSRLLRASGVASVFGGECEPELLRLARELRAGEGCDHRSTREVNLDKIDFLVPDRACLPELQRYAQLILPDGRRRVSGYTETSRGCKHLCRHCPVVPVYQGRFRVVPVAVVMADIAQQVAAGAEHISFGDPDFFNGSTHALRVLDAMQATFPRLSFDATIKVQHLIAHAGLLSRLKQAGCLFVTSAVESLDDKVLDLLAKKHTRADFEHALQLCRDAGIGLAPTFVPFTPWTSLEGYAALLRTLLHLRLVESVPAVQLSIRLLVPQGSWLLQLDGFRGRLGEFDAQALGYPWRHADARVDALQRQVQALAQAEDGANRTEVFAQIWEAAHRALGAATPALDRAAFGERIARLSEPWYCCAEPTAQQLACV